MPYIRPSTRASCAVILALMTTVVAGTFMVRPVPAARAATTAPTGLHVVGPQLLDGANRPVILRGANRSGSEYACVQGWGFFDGPSDLASTQAIASWGVNAVRIPMNEDCWLNINGAPPAYSGVNYQNAIAAYVSTAQAAGLVPILELHWTGAGATLATGQQPMLNRDHSITFWQQVANAYKNNTGVIFDLHNEPYPDGNSDTTAAWDCWKNGTTTGNTASCPGSGLNYQAAGMQETVNAVRSTGATNTVMLGGVQYSNALSQWLAYKPQDATGNLMAAWHVYNFNVCNTTACYDATAAPVAASVPLIAGEIGENDCSTGMLTTLMNWLEAHHSSYLAWTWDTWGTACSNLSLITDYTGNPTSYGQVYKDYLRGVLTTPTPTPTGTWSTATPTRTAVPPTSTPVTPSPTPGPAGVYSDSLLNQWADWSFGTSVNYGATAYVHTGSHATSVQYTGAWGGLQIGQGSTFNTGSFQALTFWINGGAASGQEMYVFVQYRDGTHGPSLRLDNYIQGGGVLANTWRSVSIPLTALAADNRSIYTFTLQDGTGGTQPTYYIDDVLFSSGGSASPTPTPGLTSTPTPTPATTIIGHLAWQGISQPSAHNQGLTGTLTICVGSTPHSVTATTDDAGTFTVTTDIPDGSYNWRFKGPRWLANAGSLTISGRLSRPELGTQRAGDASNSNSVSTADFNIVKGAFGGHSASADFNNDDVVNASDFNLLRGNFGVSGQPTGCP